MLGKSSHRVLHAVCALALVGLVPPGSASAQELKSYKSDTKEFWQHPPPDWFLGDETQAQKGLAPKDGPPTGISGAELQNSLKNIKLPPGFTISVYADGVLAARQMAWGDKGTLFVGSFGLGNVYAITDQGGKKTVKTILKGLDHADGARLSRRRALCHRGQQTHQVRQRGRQSRQNAGRQGRLRRHAQLRRSWLEISRRRQGWLVLPSVWPALQHRHSADQRVANSPCRSEDRTGGNRRARCAQQRRRRRRSAKWPLLVHRERARLDQRRSAERQAQPDLEDRRAFRLSLLPSGRSAGSRNSPWATSAASSRRRC